jgi:hypothetical protein
MVDGTGVARRPGWRTATFVGAVGAGGWLMLVGMFWSGTMTVSDAQAGRWARAAAFAFATLLPAVCVEATRIVLRRRFPGLPRTALVAAMTVGAAVGLAVGAFAIGTAFEAL